MSSSSSNTMDSLLDDWVSDINTTAAALEQKQHSPTYRQEAAFCAHSVSTEDAKNDLLMNPNDPFLFRKWLELRGEDVQLEFEPTDTEQIKEYRREKHRERVSEYTGSRVIMLLGCNCGNNSNFKIDPSCEWRYSSGDFNIKARKGPCSVWPGHIGYCWEGTMLKGAHPGGYPLANPEPNHTYSHQY